MAIPNSYDILLAVIQATPDAIFVKDLESRYVVVNEAAARFIGRSPEDVVGKHDFELYPEEDARRFMEDDRQVLVSGQPQSFEGVAIGKAGPQAYLVTKGVCRDTDGRILGLYGISHDITELRHAQDALERTREALFQSQKMEAVGQLTGGIAHDFNNILGVILGNIELLKRHLRDDAFALGLIDSVGRAALHGQELTGHLLAFSRRRKLRPQAVDVTALVDGMVRLVGPTLGATIQITLVRSAEPVVAMVDPSALEAAVLNIALNARDAMPDGGTLTIRTSRTEVTELGDTDAGVQPGSYVVLTLEDTGSGMAPELAARAFEPFFTTKAASGTGLGLSMVYGFVRQSGGSVSIASEPGRGTTVSMLFPTPATQPPA